MQLPKNMLKRDRDSVNVLPVCCDGFIMDLQHFQIDDISIASCQFSTSAYSDGLFLSQRISFPDSLDRAVRSRRAEFLAGRYMAREAMANNKVKSLPPAQISIGANRAPQWPIGVTGSITHSNNMALCAVTASLPNESIYLGVDIEKILATEAVSEVENMVCRTQEIQYLMDHGFSREMALTIIFSAKESVFKALYPYVEDYFGFEEAYVCAVNQDTCVITLTLSAFILDKVGIKGVIECYFSIQDDMVVTLVFGTTGCLKSRAL